MYQIPGTRTLIPATVVARRGTSQANAWLGGYETVQLTAPLDAIRVHVGGGGEGAVTNPELLNAAGLHGRWFGVGDFVQTYEQYRQSRALPAHFSEIAMATLLPGTIINVGRCAPLPKYAVRGGGEQIEFVEGQPARLQPLDATWSHSAGHA